MPAPILLVLLSITVQQPAALPVSVCLTSPVSAPIVERFEQPACPYCAGRRTVDFETARGSSVVAPISGVVTFVGDVAGSAYVTIALGSPGHLVTLGGVVPVDGGIAAGSVVVAGRAIGISSSGRIRLSLRRIVAGGDAVYLDPEPSLARWRAPVRLVPDPTGKGDDEVRAVPRRVVLRWTCRRPVPESTAQTGD